MSDPQAIDPAEVEFSPLSLADESGRLFFWRGRVLRAVGADRAQEMRDRFASGLVAALHQRGLIPAARLTDLRFEGFALVVEHDRLPVVTYPYEWSYRMFRAAAALVLQVNELANAHGWELKDCHGFNVLFDGPDPRYVDLGSLVPIPPGQRGWSAAEEFRCCYEYPLEIWRQGDGFTARRWLGAADSLQHESFLLYRHPFLRWFGGAPTWGRMLRAWFRFRRLSGAPEEKIRRHLSPGPAAFALWLQALPWLPAQSFNSARRRRRLMARERRWLGSAWGDYQSDYGVPTPRFRRIVETVRELQPRTVLELAGNQGWLSAQLLAAGAAARVICTDADEEAVDRAHAALAQRPQGASLHLAVLDFIFPLATSFGTPPAPRFLSDTVLALAVSHHILLTQRIAVDRFLAAVGSYARRHVLVEFMPLGLWDGKTAPPVPPWYTLDWFRDHFQRRFRLLREERLEENRVLFVGEVRPGTG
ncbi:MAG TPA: hypothetical protein VHD61_12645 [Lacunisphaera sp.]|nr:hypothetical protein [Lacunisphaera sp.]